MLKWIICLAVVIVISAAAGFLWLAWLMGDRDEFPNYEPDVAEAAGA